MGGFTPNLAVRETEHGLEIAAELPGMVEEDINLRIEGNLLTLAGEKKDEWAQDQGGLHLTERSFGRFQRAFRLPYRPDPNQVRAVFDRGILRITLSRPQQEQAGGRIQIQRTDGQQQGGQGTVQIEGTSSSAGETPADPSKAARSSPL